VKKLTKKQMDEQVALAHALDGAHEKYANAVVDVNKAIEEANELIRNAIGEDSDYQIAIGDVNEALSKCRDFRDEIVGEMDEYMADRSEKWTESDAGEAYSGWKDEWENFELDDIEPAEIAEIDEISEDESINAEGFRELVEEPGGF
jgi:hypothetical protein